MKNDDDVYIDSIKLTRNKRRGRQFSLSFWMLLPKKRVWKEFQIVGTIERGGVAKREGHVAIGMNFERPKDIPKDVFDRFIVFIRDQIIAGKPLAPTRVVQLKGDGG